MSNRSPEVDPIVMGQWFAPLNSTTPNLNSGTAARNTLTVAAAATVTFNTGTRTLEFIPSVSPTWPIFIKWGTSAGQTVATATVFDECLTPTKPSCQVGVVGFCTTYSIFSWTSQTVYVIER